MAVDRLVSRVEYWDGGRWARPAKPDPAREARPPAEPGRAPGPAVRAGASRADLVFALAQYLADAAADAEGRPRRLVPRLEQDANLPDQLRVLAADLLLAPASEAVLSEAVDAVRATGRLL